MGKVLAFPSYYCVVWSKSLASLHLSLQGAYFGEETEVARSENSTKDATNIRLAVSHRNEASNSPAVASYRYP